MMTQTAEPNRIVSMRVRQVIEENDWTQAVAAEKAGVDQSTMSYWVRGLRWPERENIKRLATAAGRSVNWFFTSDEGIPPAAALTGKKLKAVIQARDALDALLESQGTEIARLTTPVSGWWDRYPPHLQHLLSVFPLDQKEALLTEVLTAFVPDSEARSPAHKGSRKIKS